MKIRALISWLFLLCVVSATGGRSYASDLAQPACGRAAYASFQLWNRFDRPLQDRSRQGSRHPPAYQLINMTGGTNVVNQVMDGMQKNMKPMMANMLPPGDYRDKLIDLFFEKFRLQADVRVLVNLAVQMYDKYLSEEEIKGLIQFYSTPLGQKTLTVLPKLMVELQSESMKWGQDLGRQSMQEVLSEHPELRKALEDASQSAKPH